MRKQIRRILITGNEAIAEGALDAGCRFYAGYPITPQNELPAYMARRMPEVGGVFIQAESELAAINMVFGASAAGALAMTSSSSPGISLKQEGISYIAGARLPAVIINVMRGGPGLGNIWPAQSDYFQATKGGGHGDYHCLVLAPSTVQEAYELSGLAFTLADKYRNPVMLLADGMLGQMMEPLVKNPKTLPAGQAGHAQNPENKDKGWALSGCKGRAPNVVKSFYMREGDLEAFNLSLQRDYRVMQSKEARYEGLFLKDAQIILVAYGTMARIAKVAIATLRKSGVKAGLIRPITLWPFPKKAFILPSCKKSRYLVVEMSYGQMLEDVLLSVEDKRRVDFFGRSGGGVPSEEEIIKKVKRII